MTKRNEQKTHDGKDPFNPMTFSLSNFRKWMESQQQESALKTDVIGCEVEPKVNLQKIIDKMEVEDGEAYEMAKDFRRHGGVINEADGANLLIEVKSGSFIIARQYVKRKN